MKKAAKKKYIPNNTISTFELMGNFASAEIARKYLEDKIWNGKPQCPFCKQNEQSRIWTSPSKVGLYKCKDCIKKFTIMKNTVYESTKLDLRKWLYAEYVLVTARKSVSSMQLWKELGVTQKTAWFMIHRIREACNVADNEKFTNIVEIDETYIGGKEKNKHFNKRTKGTQGRSIKTKTAVVGMQTRDGKVKAGSMGKTNNETMQTLIDENIEKGSTICTDKATHYKGIKNYEHLLVNHSAGEFVKGMASTNGIESVWALLKRGYVGTFHHFTKKHIDRYVNEFAFRLSNCGCEIPTMERIDNIIKHSVNKRLTYKRLIAKENQAY